MKKTFFAIAILAAALTGCKTQNPVLEIEGGKIQGVETVSKGIYVYKGIPFAAAPVGDLRWKAPQPVTPWEGVRIADTFSAGAVQAPHDSSNPWTSEFYWNDPEFSEGCLYLNVWTSAPGKPDEKLPVAMWIHGGAYTGGWSWEPEFDGKVWAEKGVVMVTINYRLGIFGFMCHPLLAEESPEGVSGNYGILDQIAALKWVHNNIAAFGGDPDNITILGQSAGAGSVKTLVSSPLTEGLISKAIIQSGGGVNIVPDAPAAAPSAPVQMLSNGDNYKCSTGPAGTRSRRCVQPPRKKCSDSQGVTQRRPVSASGSPLRLSLTATSPQRVSMPQPVPDASRTSLT
ncbi:MAG: carboxylesterase family protein [Bacteroidia bacterium]|nr:carboxylesterase family protein [Bacteroidia bacterium]